MNINNVNLTLPATGMLPAKLSLAAGQTIFAQVARMEGSQVVLQWGETLLRAETKVDLKTGDRLKLRVVSAGSGMVELKILPENEKEAVRTNPSLLAQLGLPSQEQMETLARQFVKFNLPLSSEGLLEIYNLMRQNALPEDAGQLLAWLKSAGIKAESDEDLEALRALRDFFRGESAGQDEDKFFRFLNGAEPQVAGGYNIFGGPVGNAQVYLVQRSFGSARPSADHCQLFIRIESGYLETLWFRLELTDQRLAAEIICSREAYQAVLEKESGALKKALHGAGYRIDQLPVAVRPPQTTLLDLLPQPEISQVNVKI